MAAQASGVGIDTRLEDLTDAQRMELAQKIKDEHAQKQPLIGHIEPIDALEQEYLDNVAFVGKARWLREQAGYIGFRRARGDGDCFYRAFAFAFVEKIMHMNDRPLHHFVFKHLESTLDLLQSAGFDKLVYEDFWEVFKRLLFRIHTTDPETVELSDSELLAAFNDPETSNSIVVYLRLVVSAYLKANRDEFVPFLFSLEPEASGSNGGPPDMDSFCANQVEAVGREADHVQITALSRALKVALDVAYLSPAAAPPSTPQVEQPGALAVPGTEQKTRARADPNRVDIVKFIVENGMMLDIGTMLFRPGHYDLLIKPPPPASPEVQIPRLS